MLHYVTWQFASNQMNGDTKLGEMNEMKSTIESCHGKTCLAIFVVVIPKEGLAGGDPPILLLDLVWHWLQNITCESSRVQFYSWCHTQRRISGAPPANPSLSMTTKILRYDFPWHGSISLIECFVTTFILFSLRVLHVIRQKLADSGIFHFFGSV